MTAKEILLKHDYAGHLSLLVDYDSAIAAMHEYGIQERNKAIDEAAALMYDDGRHPQAQPDVDRILNLKNKKPTS